jgi:hypothetical protein
MDVHAPLHNCAAVLHWQHSHSSLAGFVNRPGWETARPPGRPRPRSHGCHERFAIHCCQLFDFSKHKTKGKAKKADESEAPTPVAQEVALDPVEAAVQKFASLAQAKAKAEQEMSGVREMLALETKAKGEAQAARA